MIVYHGTSLEIKRPQILRGDVCRDFGFAFYTTDIKEQAEKWAIRKAGMATRMTGQKSVPIVNAYIWDDTATGLGVKDFPTPSIEWLNMVVKCRSGASYEHPYDIVAGKIADDNVGETVFYVTQGIMRPEDALERLKFEKINNQIAFCTEAALRTLKFLESYTVGG